MTQTNTAQIIEIYKYRNANAQKEQAKHFPIIYALQNANGEPLILFRFIKDEEAPAPEVSGNSGQIISLSEHLAKRNAQ